MNEEIKKIQQDNWKQINYLMVLRQKQFEDIYQDRWWEYLVEDVHYKFLIEKLVEIHLFGKSPYTLDKDRFSKEDIKRLQDSMRFDTKAQQFIDSLTKENKDDKNS